MHRNGWPANEEVMRARVECVEKLQLLRFPGHHHFHMDEPGPLAASIRDFWSRLSLD